MSEMKRVAFTTISSSLGPADTTAKKSSTSGGSGGFSTAAALLHAIDDDDLAMMPPAAPPAPNPSGSSQNQTPKTFRLDLELFDTNADSFPEFSFSKLVHVEKKKMKKQSKSNGFVDPFEENDDDVARIAKEFEKKYSGSNSGKERRSKNDDYYDKGAGYDESDSFIDNTEAYDEIIPEEVETVGGGFYINCGALEFTRLASTERPDDAIKMSKTRKRALSTSSSSEGDEDHDVNSKKTTVDVKDSIENVVTTGNTSPKDSAVAVSNKFKNGHIDKKLKTAEENKELLLNLKVTKPLHKDKKLEKLKVKESGDGVSSGCGGEVNLSDSGNEKDKEKEIEKDKDKEKEKIIIKTTTVKDMLKAKRDNFRKMQEEEVKSGGVCGGGVSSSGTAGLMNGEKDSDTNDSETESSTDSETEPQEKKIKRSADSEDGEKMRTTDVKLPNDLPANLLKDIEELKATVRGSMQAEKSFHFTDKMIDIFLRIDDSCSCLDKSIRNLVFAHLEFQMSLTKYYLLRKARTLRIKQERNKTKRAYMKLKKSVDEVMPSIVMNYESNCRKVDELRLIAIQTNVDSSYLPKYPRKKFVWNDTIRNLLHELYQVRWTSSVVLRTRKETLNDFITNYLKEKVVPVWPSGWMKYEELKKELDKRKRPKDTKLPGDETTKERKDETGKSLLAGNNAVSIVSTKDLVVTISTKTDKKTEVPLSTSDTLTVTPITVDGSNRSGNGSKTDGHKSHKSGTSSALSSSSALASNRSTSPLTEANRMHGSSKSGSTLQGNHSSSNTHKSSSKSKHSSDSKTSSTSSSNSSQSSKKSKTVDLTSPTKRATDHSINSIMSSRTTPSPTLHSVGSSPAASTTAPLSLTTKSSAGSGTASNSDTAITHVITVDNLKNTSDIINTSNKLINNIGGSNSSGTAAANVASTTGPNGAIRIRTVDSVNNCLEKEKVKEKERKRDVMANQIASNDIRPASRSSILDDLVISGSDSDGVEIVGVFPVPTKKRNLLSSAIPISSSQAAAILPNPYADLSSTSIRSTAKHKDNQRSNNNSRSSSPSICGRTGVSNLNKLSQATVGGGKTTATVNSRYNDLESSRRNLVESNMASAAVAAIDAVNATASPVTTMASGSGTDGDKDNDLDVFQIMQALKELEVRPYSQSNDRSQLSEPSRREFKKEMQQSNIHISSSKSPTNNRSGGSHASPINYI